VCRTYLGCTVARAVDILQEAQGEPHATGAGIDPGAEDGNRRQKRAQAAEELRDYDSVKFAEIVPVLVDVLKNDKKPTVRVEALNSLAKIRPVTALAGQAIEKAAADDDTWRVRWQAKAALTKYYLAGYTSKKSEPKGATTDEPPLAEPNAPLPLPRFEPMEAPRVTPPVGRPKTPPTQQQGPSLFP
jgi:hypothetical protein